MLIWQQKLYLFWKPVCQGSVTTPKKSSVVTTIYKNWQELKLFISIRDQSEILRKFINEIKADIKLLTAINKEVTEKINDLEEDSYEEDDNFNGTRFELKQYIYCLSSNLVYIDKLHEMPLNLKCGECDFVGNADMSLVKHRNKKSMQFLMMNQ